MNKRIILSAMALMIGCGSGGSTNAERETESSASAVGTADLVGHWKGPNCAGMGAGWENIVYLHISSGTSATVRYYYPGLSFSCYSDLTKESSAPGQSRWSDTSTTAGCVDGSVLMTYTVTSSDSMRYTWSDPTGGTPSCTGILNKL